MLSEENGVVRSGEVVILAVKRTTTDISRHTDDCEVVCRLRGRLESSDCDQGSYSPAQARAIRR